MCSKNFYVWDVSEMYFANNPESEGTKQLCRKVIVEELDEKCNLTGNKFICILEDHSALAELKFGDVIEAKLSFDVDENFNQLVYGKIKN